MRSPQSFEAFYAASRDRLLHETYALTGDLAASRTAVRDAFAVAWHHWRKVALLDDPEKWVRPLAHGRARRRASARLWHRDKSLEPEVRETLDALSDLSGSQRQLLVLHALAPLSERQVARVAGKSRTDAETELSKATAKFTRLRGVEAEDIPRLLDDLRAPLEGTRWPRGPIVRRAGTARRRLHTAAGAALAAVVMAGSGVLVATGAGAETSTLQGSSEAADISVTQTPEVEPTLEDLDTDNLLADSQVERLDPQLDWAETVTKSGDSPSVACQRDPYADPDGTGVLVRRWTGSQTVVQKKQVRRNGKTRTRRVRKDQVRSTVVQIVERSADATVADSTYRVVLGWFAGCADPRTQLMATRTVTGVGDAAAQLRLRTWGKQGSTISASVARSGRLVVTTVVQSRARPVDDRASLLTLAASVNRLCGSADTESCSGRPAARAVDPLVLGTTPGLLTPVDLPPVGAVRGPWVGTEAEPAMAVLSATNCAAANFRVKGIRNPLSRFFSFPQTRRAGDFGLTQTVAHARNRGRAVKFLEDSRQRVRACAVAELGTSVTSLASRSTKKTELHAWHLQIELSDQQSRPFFMAVVREGKRISQIGFTPQGEMSMSRESFVAMAERSLQRLSDLERS